jgi:hypothetical protein
MGIPQHPSPRRRGASYPWVYLMRMSHWHRWDHSGSNTKNKESGCSKKVKHKRTFKAVAPEMLDDGTRVITWTGLRLRDEAAPPMEAGAFQLGLWKQLVNMGQKMHDH